MVSDSVLVLWIGPFHAQKIETLRKDLKASWNRGLDWQSEGEENLEAEPIPKSA